jgi:hypothetical protein
MRVTYMADWVGSTVSRRSEWWRLSVPAELPGSHEARNGPGLQVLRHLRSCPVGDGGRMVRHHDKNPDLYMYMVRLLVVGLLEVIRWFGGPWMT